MRESSLGNRMKEYERASEVRLTRRLPMIVRLDGRALAAREFAHDGVEENRRTDG